MTSHQEKDLLHVQTSNICVDYTFISRVIMETGEWFNEILWCDHLNKVISLAVL